MATGSAHSKGEASYVHSGDDEAGSNAADSDDGSEHHSDGVRDGGVVCGRGLRHGARTLPKQSRTWDQRAAHAQVPLYLPTPLGPPDVMAALPR